MAKSTRLKPESDILSKTEFEAVLDEIATLQIERDKLTVKRDKKLLELREAFDPEINTLNEKMQSRLLRADRFATIHRESLFGKLKSSATALTVFGFRLGNPTLKLLNKKWSWETVLETLKARSLTQFVISTEKPDKDSLKAQLNDEELAAVGCRIDQAESFFVEPKRDAAPDQRMVSDGGAAK